MRSSHYDIASISSISTAKSEMHEGFQTGVGVGVGGGTGSFGDVSGCLVDV